MAALGLGPQADSAEGGGTTDEGEWPDAKDESAYLSEAAQRGETTAPAKVRVDSPVLGETLPSLESLVEQVPEDLRRVLDDLFRAKFTTVRRIFPDPDAA